MDKWIINIHYPTDFLNLFENLQNKYAIFKLYESNQFISPAYDDGTFAFTYKTELYNFLAGISYHEFGHSKECPIDVNYFSMILQAVSTALEQNNVFNNKVLNHIVNLFTDTIINIIYGLNADNSFFRNSIFTFYFSELMQFDITDLSFYYFLLLNLKAFLYHIPIREALETILLPKMPKDYKQKLTALINIFCPFADIARNMDLGVVPTEDERWKIINHISERDKWDQMAYEFAKLLYNEVSDHLLEEHPPIPNSTFTKLFEEDKSFQKEVFDLILERKLAKKAPNKSPTSKKLDPTTKKDQSKELYPDEFDLERGLGFFDRNEIYDGLYRYRIKDMNVLVPSEEENTKNVLTWLNREIISEDDNIMNFDPLNVYFLPKSEDLLLFKKTIPLTDDIQGAIQEQGFPNIAFFCDDSGSMSWRPNTSKGKYDALIITIYSFLEWLKNKGFASVIKYNFTFFSTTTRSTGWLNYFQLDEVKNLLFYHEGGTTNIDLPILTKIIQDPKKKAVIMITDGEIFNNKPILRILDANRNNLIFLFLQIGKLSDFANKLKKSGFNVIQIKNITRLSQIVLNFIENTYQDNLT